MVRALSCKQNENDQERQREMRRERDREGERHRAGLCSSHTLNVSMLLYFCFCYDDSAMIHHVTYIWAPSLGENWTDIITWQLPSTRSILQSVNSLLLASLLPVLRACVCLCASRCRMIALHPCECVHANVCFGWSPYFSESRRSAENKKYEISFTHKCQSVMHWQLLWIHKIWKTSRTKLKSSFLWCLDPKCALQF